MKRLWFITRGAFGEFERKIVSFILFPISLYCGVGRAEMAPCQKSELLVSLCRTRS